MIDSETLSPIVKSNAGSVRRMYPIVEYGDLEGIQWEWVYSNKEAVQNYLDGNAHGLLSNRLRTIAMRYARSENEIANGREPDDLYVYNQRTVTELLKDVFDYEGWQPYQPNGGDGMPTSKKLVNESGDRMAMLADVSAALKQVPDEQYNLLVWTYKYGYTHAKLASTLEISEEAARMRVSRAVAKVVQVLMGMAPSTSEGADPEYVGTRKVMSNAQSNALTSSYLD